MQRIGNMVTQMVFKDWSGMLRIRPYRSAQNLGDRGTWLPIESAVKYAYTLLRSSVGEHLAHPIA